MMSMSKPEARLFSDDEIAYILERAKAFGFPMFKGSKVELMSIEQLEARVIAIELNILSRI